MAGGVDWHKRYKQQAGWTSQTRLYLYEKARIKSARRILDVGCGTGALLEEFPPISNAGAFGIDIDMKSAKKAGTYAPASRTTCGDGHRLPYADRTFDITFCHFLLLWVKSPVEVLSEMKRVTRAGGAVLALAEPDYSGRIDYPSTLAPIGRWQAESLRKQGADPDSGRKLKGWFSAAGIPPIESGVMAGGWPGALDRNQWELEWSVLESDLEQVTFKENLLILKELDLEAWDKGQRVLFVPTFYAWGTV